MKNLQQFTRDQIRAEIKRRLEAEEASSNAMQMAVKTLMNSLYGAMANQHFRYFSTDIAEGITLTGQLAVRIVEDRINKELNKRFETSGIDYVVMIDTDSVVIRLESFVNKILNGRVIDDKHKIVDMIDAFCKREIEPFIASVYKELTENLKFYENSLYMKREKIIDRGIWRAKKNYVIQVFDNEGVRYKEAKLVSVGVEIVKSSTPAIVKSALKKGVNIILNEDEEALQKFVSQFKIDYMKADLYDIAFPRGVKEIDKWSDSETIWKLKTPIHVKGCLVFNHLLKSTGLHLKQAMITDGDKIKFVYLKTPNTVHSNVISFLNNLPEEFNMDSCIDYETQFEKSFISPMSSFSNILGWTLMKENQLNDFFSDAVPNLVEFKKPIIEFGPEDKKKPGKSTNSKPVEIKRVKNKKSKPSDVGSFFQ